VTDTSKKGKIMTVDRETAERDFERFREKYRIKIGESVDENERNDTLNAKGTVLDAITEGQLVIDDQCRPVFTLANGTELTFDDPGAAALVKTDNKKSHAQMAKACIMLSECTGASERTFANMKPYADFKVCMALLLLFLV
jgi:hypothetical protein